jgi:hypothetical protein
LFLYRLIQYIQVTAVDVKSVIIKTVASVFMDMPKEMNTWFDPVLDDHGQIMAPSATSFSCHVASS